MVFHILKNMKVYKKKLLNLTQPDCSYHFNLVFGFYCRKTFTAFAPLCPVITEMSELTVTHPQTHIFC